jgi:hypothetical protein
MAPDGRQSPSLALSMDFGRTPASSNGGAPFAVAQTVGDNTQGGFELRHPRMTTWVIMADESEVATSTGEIQKWIDF